MHAIMLYILACANLIFMLHLGLYVVGANTYDVLHLRTARAKAKKPVRRNQKNALVTVVIPAHNEALCIRRTLDSVLCSSYHEIEIIVVDDGSTDKTVNIVRKYIANLPQVGTTSYIARRGRKAAINRRFKRTPITHAPVVLVTQSNQGKGSAMNNAIANHAHGKFVMCLDGDSVLHPSAIEHAVAYFKDRRVMGVAANVRVMEAKTWLGVLQRFEHMIGYRSKKFYSLTNSEFIIGGVASTYRTSALKRVKLYDTDTLTEDIGLSMKLVAHYGNRKHRIIYAADVVAMTEGVQTFRALMRQRYRWKMGNLQNLFKYRALIGNQDHSKYSHALTTYRLPMAILSEIMLMIEPLLLSYIIYLSIHYHTFGILLGAYLTMTCYVFWNLWPDEHLKLEEKLRMSLLACGMYILFYAMDIVQLAAIFRCIFAYRKIIDRSTLTTWASPTRSGQTASF